jgi:hypothetical protein
MANPLIFVSLAGAAAIASQFATPTSLPAVQEQIGKPLQAATPSADYDRLPNLIQNGSFEMDWMHNAVSSYTRFQLLEQSDWGYAQADGQPDSWVLPETARIDAKMARFGRASLRLRGTASQVVYVLGETEPRDGGAFYNPFVPLPAELAKTVHPRPLRFGAWCKTDGATAEPSLSVAVEYGEGASKSKSFSVKFASGTHDWQYAEIAVPAVAELGSAHAAVVRLEFQGEGKAWFDGAAATEQPAGDEPNLLGAEVWAGKGDGRPGPDTALWPWSRREYYRFTGWSHEKGAMKGGARYADGGHNASLPVELVVQPGDNLAVCSRPIQLNQSQPRVLEVSAWVRAQDLRWLEIMAKDETGQWLPQQDFSGFMGTDQQTASPSRRRTWAGCLA